MSVAVIEESGFCPICGVVSRMRCANCADVFYCSATHQKQDWKIHKNICHPFKIESSPKFGRYLCASRDIKVGEIVLKELPIVSGPSQITGPICIICLDGLDEAETNDQIVEQLRCGKCGWPICKKCTQAAPKRAVAAHEAECQVTAARGGVKIDNYVTPHPMYQSLMTLRCLLLKGDVAKQLHCLESHDEKRRATPQWTVDKETIAKFVKRFFNLPQALSEEEIMRVVGIIQVNGHEVPLTEPPHVSIYNLASLLEHNCLPNLTKSFANNGAIVMWANREIKRGSHLSISYTDVLWGTLQRRQHLLETKYFVCDCIRCMDVTEIRSNFSALACTKKNCSGVVLPVDSDSFESNWVCRECSNETTYNNVKKILDQIGADIAAMEKGSVEACKKFLDHYKKLLYKFHFYMVDIGMALAQLLGSDSEMGGIQRISDEDLELKTELSKQLLVLFNVIAPSESRALGTLHFELHASLAERSRRLGVKSQMKGNRKNNANTELIGGLMEESLMHAEAAGFLLGYEPSSLPEGAICAQSKVNINSLRLLLGMPVI